MKLWIDDIREPSSEYLWIKSVNKAIQLLETDADKVTLIDIDHDAGEYASDGGDYYKILDWMEMMGINNIPIHIHSMNPVGCQRMMAIIQKNHWQHVST